MKEIRNQWIFTLLLIVAITWAITTETSSSSFTPVSNHSLSRTSNKNYHISDNLPLGTVITDPEDLGGGIYLIQVQMDESNHYRPTVYSAITAQPEQFSVNSKARLKNITAYGQNASSDMFHVAIKP